MRISTLVWGNVFFFFFYFEHCCIFTWIFGYITLYNSFVITTLHVTPVVDVVHKACFSLFMKQSVVSTCMYA